MYDRVVVEEVSQYVVAAEEKLTQGYVSKRVRRVIEWMGRVGNKEYGAAPAHEKLLYLQRFAEKKYDHYRRESEAAFRESRQDLVVIKERGTREAAADGDEKHVGKFVGEVKIEKTIRPREGKPQFLREARLGVDNLVLLACHIVSRQQLPLPSEPNEEAERQEREYIARELAEKRILDSRVACRDQEIWSLKHELAAARRELESVPVLGEGLLTPPSPPTAGLTAAEEAKEGRPTDSHFGGVRRPAPNEGRPAPNEGGEVGRPAPNKPAVPTRRLILESHDPACVPLKESELWKLEKSGVAWLAELGELIATLIPINEYDTAFRNNLVTLWRNAERNYRLQGIIPERQKFPSLESIRKGVPFSMSIPTDRGKYSRA